MAKVERKQRIVCGGCGRVITASQKRDPDEVNDPIDPPESWLRVFFMGQDAAFGSVAAFTVFTCSERCSEQVIGGGGVAAPVIRAFQTYLVSIKATATEPMVEEDEDDDAAKFEEGER